MDYPDLRKVYGETLLRLGKSDSRIVALGADLCDSTRITWFGKEFPERFFNMGIAEQDMIGTAAGLALTGKIPFVSTFAIFAAGRPWEQIRQSIVFPKLNVKIVSTHSGVTVGEDGASHHCIEDIALMRVLPGMTIIVPADGYETEKAIVAIGQMDGPAYVRLSRWKFPLVFDKDYHFEIGKGNLMKSGDDITLVGAGLMVSRSLEAAEILDREGISARVVHISTIKPIDREILIQAARETEAIVTAEEHSIIGGLGSAVAEVIAEECPVPMRRVGVQDVFGTSGRPEALLKAFSLTSEDIVAAAHKVLEMK